MEEQYLKQTLVMDTEVFSKLVNKYLPKIEEVQNKIPAKPKYQFQELTKKLYPIYGDGIFKLPYRTFYSDYKLEKAHEATEKFCKDPIKENRFKYLCSCMRKMPY